jgi:hypothetical protein
MIQQFVNSKTNRPISFSYRVFPFEGVQIGVFHFPLQDRPIFIRTNFGKLKKNEVYIRRGSSTAIADPDEVAKMGRLNMNDFTLGSSIQQRIDPVVAELRAELKSNAIVLVEKIFDYYNRPRFQCKITEVNDLYANFRDEKGGQEISGSIAQISVSYEPVMKMKLFTIAPIT